MEREIRKREITLTKELGEALKKKYPNQRVFSNRCPSKSSVIRNRWKNTFRELCPPLQPEIDLIIWEPPNPIVPNDEEKLRAIEIKYFKKTDGKINQSFYKGIEQSLALLQWGFDNVALWQLFDESLSELELCNYGGRTWLYIHDRLKLPIDFTMLNIVDAGDSTHRFQVVQPDWDNFPIIIPFRMNIDDAEFQILWRYKNPFRNPPSSQLTTHPLLRKFTEESKSLRTFLLDWLKVE
jgi:hypothetical protein